MTVRILSAALAMTVLSACSQGQKGRSTEMKTSLDSVSYAIGADIGANLKRSKMDSLNVDIMAKGLRDGMDSTVKIDAEVLQAVMESFMGKMQERRQAEERSAAEFGIETDIRGRERIPAEAEGAGHSAERSEFSRIDDGLHHLGAWMVNPHDAVHQMDIVRPGRVDHFPRGGDADGDGLFDQEMFPGFSGIFDPFKMEVRWEREVDDVDIRIVDHRLIAADGIRDAVFCSPSFRLLKIAAADRRQFATGG